jgi:hypothetical protein
MFFNDKFYFYYKILLLNLKKPNKNKTFVGDNYTRHFEGCNLTENMADFGAKPREAMST